MAKRILAPMGPGERAEAVVPIVAALARGAGATVRLVRVFPVPELVVGDHGRTVAYRDQEAERLTARGLEELGHLEARMDGVPVETVVRFGDTVEEILQEAGAFGADLIVLAAPARGGLRGALGAEVADRVARQAPVPTLTLRD
jgi:nucleotide-binding universal stress UspA family protein